LEVKKVEDSFFLFTTPTSSDNFILMIGYLYVAIAGMLAGLIVFGGQVLHNLGLSAVEISLFPYVLSALFLFPFLIKYKLLKINLKLFWLLVFWGLASTGTVIGQFFSLYYGIPVAIVVLLLYSQPLWTTLICRYFFKEKVKKREILACIIVLVGVIILVDPSGLGGSYNLTGLALALFGGLSLSGWIIGGSLLGKRNNNPLNSQFWGLIFGVISLLILIPVFKLSGMPSDIVNLRMNLGSTVWIILILFSLLAVNLCHLFYLNGSRRIPTVHSGIMMLLEPVVGCLLAVIFLNQELTINIIIGGVLILFANYLIVTSPSQNKLI
jgi:drug/metabolite transporter (DMT)-like permease